ncbi:MAG: alpha/beta fold hydrolase [Nitriliruptorales bacterium]|nr:alpha/beta fold hydrolase [Nitriliruptorales bacterium]
MGDQLHVTRRGEQGPVVVLVHGTAMPGRMTWAPQKPLADRYQLWIVDRRGYGQSPPLRRREDFEADAEDLLDVAPQGAHLVAISYGTIGALIAAATEPERFASLTVVECPAFRLAPGDLAATDTMARLDALHADTTLDDHSWLERFAVLIGSPAGFPKPLPSPFDETVTILRRHRRSWDRDLPLDGIAAARLPVMVVTSGEHAAFEAVADHLTAVLDASRERIGGHGHLVPLAADRFNAVLDDFLQTAGART